jgi:hypothetical protein
VLSSEPDFSFHSSFTQCSTLGTRLLPQFGGQARIRTLEADGNRFTVCPLWPLGYLPKTPCTRHNKNLNVQFIIIFFTHRDEKEKARQSTHSTPFLTDKDEDGEAVDTALLMKRWILLMKSGEVNTLKHNYLAFRKNIAADRRFLRSCLPPPFHFTVPATERIVRPSPLSSSTSQPFHQL